MRIREYNIEQPISVDGSQIMIGKKFNISGMIIEIISDEGDKWKTRNITTKETVFFNKTVLQDAIKLGKAEEISDVVDEKLMADVNR